MAFSFNNLPINTLVGADIKTFNHVTRTTPIDRVAKYRSTKICQRILAPLYRLNDRAYGEIPKPEIISPLFIIGHWRSGTTLLHNLLSRDPQFGYCTTYHTVFPHLMLRSDGVVKSLAERLMPSSRPTDHLALSLFQPQEEEFAIANMTHAAYYHFWIFPQKMAHYREKYLLFDSCSPQELAEFRSATLRVMQTALYCQGKGRFLSKNPPHTARIPTLLQMFPDAKFIYIYRDTDEVIRSTKRFFCQTLDALSLQNISNVQLNHEIVTTYHAVINRYEQTKTMIAPENLCEISFRELSAHPTKSVEHIYRQLKL